MNVKQQTALLGPHGFGAIQPHLAVLAQWRPPIIGAALYCLGHVDPRWASYDIQGQVATELARRYVHLRQEQKPEDEMDIYWDLDLTGLRIEGGKIMGLLAGLLPADVAPGETYFKLVSATFLDEVQARGLHNVYVDVLDEDGRRINGTTVEHGWPWERWPAYDEVVTDTVFGDHLAQWDIYADFNPNKVPYGPYWVRVQGKSDVFYGMGLSWKRHVSWAVVFQRCQAEAPQPAGPQDPQAALRDAFEDQYADLRGQLPTDSQQTYPPRLLSAIRRIIVHHSASPQNTTPEAIARYHVSKGWPGIGYHLLITAAGEVRYVGDLTTVRYHAGNANADSIGICCIGNYHNVDAVPIPMVAALHAVVQVLRTVLASDATLPVIGHREAPGATTVCPGDDLYVWLPYVNRDELTLAQQLVLEGEHRRVLRLNPDAALMKAIRADGFVPVSDEFSFTRDGAEYVGWLAEDMGGIGQYSGQCRVYYAQVGDWAHVQYVVRP